MRLSGANLWISITWKDSCRVDRRRRSIVKAGLQTHWWRISVTVALDAAGRIEETLEVLGALAVTRTDAGDSPQFDGAVPDRPRWALQSISGLFPPEADIPTLKAQLMAVGGPAQRRLQSTLPIRTGNCRDALLFPGTHQ